MANTLLCLVLGLTLIVCVTSSTPYEEGEGEDEVPHTKFRDKRTLDFILRGLANVLGYRLEKDNGPTPTTAKPTPKPTTATTASPAQVLLLNVADIVEKTRKNNAAKPTTPKPKPCKQEYQHFHYNIQSTEKPRIETYNRLQSYSYTLDVPTKGNIEEYKKFGYTLDPEAKSKPNHSHSYHSNYKHFEGEGDHSGRYEEDFSTKERDERKPSKVENESSEKHRSHDHYTYHEKDEKPYYHEDRSKPHTEDGYSSKERDERKPSKVENESSEEHRSHDHYSYHEKEEKPYYHEDRRKPHTEEDYSSKERDERKHSQVQNGSSDKHRSHDHYTYHENEETPYHHEGRRKPIPDERQHGFYVPHEDHGNSDIHLEDERKGAHDEHEERRKPAHTEKETSERHHGGHEDRREPSYADHHHHTHGYNLHLENEGFPEHVVHLKVDFPYFGHDYGDTGKQRQHQHLLKDAHKAPEDDYVSKEIAVRGKEEQEDKRENYDHQSDSYGNLRWGGQEAFFRDKEGDKGSPHALEEYNVIPPDFWGGNWLESYNVGARENPKKITHVSEEEHGRSVTTVSGVVITERGPKDHQHQEDDQYTTTVSGDTTTGGVTTLSREEYRDSPTTTPEKIQLHATEPSPMPVLSTYRPKLVQTLHEGTGNLLPPSPFDDEFAGRHGGGDFSVVGKLTRASQKVVASPLPFLVSVYNRSSVSDLVLDNKPKTGYVGLAIPNTKPEAAIHHPDAPPEPSFYGVVVPRKWLQKPTKKTPQKITVQQKNSTNTARAGLGVRLQVNKSKDLPPSVIRVSQGQGNRSPYRDALDIPLDELRYPGRETQQVVAIQNPTPVAIPFHPTPSEFQPQDSNSEFLRTLQLPYQLAAPTPSSPQEYHLPDANRDFLRTLQLPYHPVPPTQGSQQQFRLVVPDHHQQDDQPFRLVFSNN